MPPDGAATDGMLVFAADDNTGGRIGTVWLGLGHPRDVASTGFLWDIECQGFTVT